MDPVPPFDGDANSAVVGGCLMPPFPPFFCSFCRFAIATDNAVGEKVDAFIPPFETFVTGYLL
jgi:hypothetical protein